MVDDLHCKLAKFLCSNYDVILLPEFNVQDMVAREREDGHQRSISGKTAREMLRWAHHRFKQRLLCKQHQFGGCRVYIVNEAYTTKTCGACGELNEDIGSKETFHCPYCDYEADRDYNAARNIYLKWLLEQHDAI
jgi:putative transposase